MKNSSEIKALLDEQVDRFNNKQFVEKDPVSIPHLFSQKEDIEIAGFLAATISWGNRNSILKNARQLMQIMDDAPFNFVTQHTSSDLKSLKKFVHRTFNGADCIFFIRSVKHIYQHHGGLEAAFVADLPTADLKDRIVKFRARFLEIKHLHRSEKHISDPAKKSSAKRICMFLRWMVRNDKRGVDFGIWKTLSPADLYLPLDVHTGNVSRELGLLQRKQNDWQAVDEITRVLREFDRKDPVKYDFALFGMGVNKVLRKK